MTNLHLSQYEVPRGASWLLLGSALRPWRQHLFILGIYFVHTIPMKMVCYPWFWNRRSHSRNPVETGTCLYFNLWKKYLKTPKCDVLCFLLRTLNTKWRCCVFVTTKKRILRRSSKYDPFHNIYHFFYKSSQNGWCSKARDMKPFLSASLDISYPDHWDDRGSNINLFQPAAAPQ